MSRKRGNYHFGLSLIQKESGISGIKTAQTDILHLKERKGEGDGTGETKNPDMPDLRCHGSSASGTSLLRHVTASFGFRGEWDAGKQPDGRRRK